MSLAKVDVVVVAYNSADTLHACVAPLSARDDVHVIVVDNASPDASLEAVADLPVQAIRAGRNGGFSAGCNVGIAAGSAPYVLLLNPDARMDGAALDHLVAVLDADPAVGIAAPRILEDDGRLSHSLRRFPRRRSTFAQALFLHRFFPAAAWSDELIRDPGAYERSWDPEWVSGACMLIRREALEAVGGMDEDYFLYCEDIDVCARVRAAGWTIRFTPDAVISHEGGHSAPREELLVLLARNRVLYARKHARRAYEVPLEAAGVALSHFTHALAAALRPAVRRGHMKALAAALSAPRESR